jgi:type III pantothenate kinase
MYLIIDLGNTNKKLALYDNGRLVKLEVFPELSLPMVMDFADEKPGITHCILSSVISYPSSVRNFLKKNFFFIELDEHTSLPIRNLYKTPVTLGKDRLAAAVAGHLRFRGDPVLVINAGSCITYDLVNENGEYLGGSISPGIQMRFRALHTFTGKLPLINGNKRVSLTGTTTRESVLSGVINGSVAEVEGIASQYLQKYNNLHVILSGGDMKYFDTCLKIKTFAVPNIVTEGLYQILELNAGKNL